MTVKKTHTQNWQVIVFVLIFVCTEKKWKIKYMTKMRIDTKKKKNQIMRRNGTQQKKKKKKQKKVFKTNLHTARWLSMEQIHRHKRSMAVDKPINRQLMVQRIRIKTPYSSQSVGPNPSHTIYCPIANLNFVMCHYLWAIFHALPIESIGVQHLN